MKTVTKIGLSALFSLILTACDKPATQSAEKKAEPAAQTEVKQETAKVEEVKPVDTGAEDYKTLREWQDTQEKALNDAVSNATNTLTEKQKGDATFLKEAMNQALLAQLDQIKASAETLNIQNPEVKALKDKTLEVLALGTQMIVEGGKMEKNPTPEAHKAFGELQTKLNQIAEEGQQLENALKAKYAPAPAPAPAPQQ